jgi:PAS domain S-box-containing protein
MSVAAPPTRSAFGIVLTYLVVAGLWILFSDKILGYLVSDRALLVDISVYKGLAFVAVTSALLYVLISRFASRLQVALDSLQSNEQKYRELVENSNSLVLQLDMQGRITYINEYAESFFGYPNDTVQGRFAGDTIFSPGSPSGASLTRMLREIGETPGLFASVLLEHRGRDGAGAWIAWANTPVLDAQGDVVGIRSIGNDVTDRKRAELEVLGWQRRFELVASASGQVVYDWDIRNGAITWSGSIERVLGYDLEEMGGGISQWEALIDPADHDEAIAMLASAQRDLIPYEMEYGFRHKDGHFVRMLDRGFILADSSCRPEHMVGVMEDITDRKRGEEERTRLHEQLAQAQKMEAMGQLAGGIAHDFNNLLQIILGHAQLALEDVPATERTHRDLTEIQKASESARALVRQLLVFSRKSSIRIEHVDLNELIGGLTGMLGRIIGEHIDLRFVPGAGSLRILADSNQLEQVVLNLCVNARDAMPHGGTLTLETATVQLDGTSGHTGPERRPGNYVRLSLSDTGVGIPEDVQDRIFEPFFTTKAPGKGTGLGLATVYAVVERHGGFVDFSSAEGRGTTFHIHFPVDSTTDDHSSDEHGPIQVEHGAGETILLAEDDEQIRLMATSILEKGGYRVVAAQDGEHALTLFDQHADRIALAVLDVVMPKLTGKAVREAILAAKPGLPVLFTSGYAFDVLGASPTDDADLELLQKPFEAADLLRNVARLLARSRAARQE